jgi:hypothetical protein
MSQTGPTLITAVFYDMGYLSRTDDELERLKKSHRKFSKSTGNVDRNESSDRKEREKFSAYKKLITPGFYGSAKHASKSQDELR